MHFGLTIQRLTVEEWKGFYIDYSGLKNTLTQFQPDFSKNADVHIRFFTELEEGINTVERFYRCQLKLYKDILAKTRLSFYHQPDKLTQQQLQELTSAALQVANDLALLGQYVTLNRTAVRKIVKKHDKLSGTTTLQKVLDSVADKRTFFHGKDQGSLGEEAERFHAELCKFIVRRFF
mmetsp:Transcript_48791/g.95703  ORF Transcript_48791/g.95703 Transcript_48791/m.95703 type:complete len:178 (-) Transcript_48791:99-632(-)